MSSVTGERAECRLQGDQRSKPVGTVSTSTARGEAELARIDSSICPGIRGL
jgi:hypothetical protein